MLVHALLCHCGRTCLPALRPLHPDRGLLFWTLLASSSFFQGLPAPRPACKTCGLVASPWPHQRGGGHHAPALAWLKCLSTSCSSRSILGCGYDATWASKSRAACTSLQAPIRSLACMCRGSKRGGWVGAQAGRVRRRVVGRSGRVGAQAGWVGAQAGCWLGLCVFSRSRGGGH